MDTRDLVDEATNIPSDSSDIRNCEFAFKCPKRWQELTSIDGGDLEIRFCSKCEQKVYRCTTDAEIALAIKANRCVAIRLVHSRDDVEEIHMVGLIEETGDQTIKLHRNRDPKGICHDDEPLKS